MNNSVPIITRQNEFSWKKKLDQLFTESVILLYHLPVCPSFLSACVSLAKRLLVRCHTFTVMSGEGPLAALIGCNAFLCSALITVGNHKMLLSFSFVLCLKFFVFLSSFFLNHSYSLSHLSHMHI